MKKYGILVFLFFILISINVRASNIYTPIGDGLDFEKINENNKKSNITYSTNNITNDEIIKYAGQPDKISKQYYRLSKIEKQYQTMRYNTYNHRPKGVVVHATAAGPNDDIDREIKYMNNNWYNAFVHQFNDDQEIIETHNPQYAAWGAGPEANKYYIHTELVETGSKKVFMKSINNQAYYVAYKLREFNLKPSRAHKDKSGSVWFHSEVTKYLGGTDHSDPTGYYKKHGYSLSKFYKLVVYHYEQIEDFYTKKYEKQYYNNNQVKRAITRLYYKDVMVEKKIKDFNKKNKLTTYQIYAYDLKGKKLVYHRKKYQQNERITSYLKKTYQTNGRLLTKNNSYYNSKQIIAKKIERKYYSKNRIKNYRIIIYKSKFKNNKYYPLRKTLENRVYSTSKKRLNVKKYYYNKEGKLRKLNNSQAKRVEYIYQKGKLKKKMTRYYTKTGKLAKKTYYKYYK